MDLVEVAGNIHLPDFRYSHFSHRPDMRGRTVRAKKASFFNISNSPESNPRLFGRLGAGEFGTVELRAGLLSR